MTLNIRVLEQKMNIMKFDDTIANLKTMLPAADFIITGSYVLAKYGLMPWDKIYDIDIILVKPEANAVILLNNYMKDHPAPSTSKLKSTVLVVPETEDRSAERIPSKFGKVQSEKALQAIFMFGDTKVDVFIENGFNEPTLLIGDFKHTTVPHIINAKKSYGRMKDWMQCREMSCMFYIEEEFRAAINKDWRSMLKGDY
jgi:hypothetical protein